jgi:hypothetical protein
MNAISINQFTNNIQDFIKQVIEGSSLLGMVR